MRRALAWSLALVSAACGGEPAQPTAALPGLEAAQLREVVASNLARLEAEVAALATEPSAPPEDLDQRLDGLFETVRGSHDNLRSLALEELRGLGDAAVPWLAERLLDCHLEQDRRLTAAELLAVLDTPAAAQALLSVLESARSEVEREPWLYAQCAWRLGQTRQSWVAPRMYLCLKYETDYASVVWTADSLARMGLLSGLDALFVVAADDSDTTVQAQAAGVLERLRAELGCADWFELASLWNEGRLERLPPGPGGPRFELEVWRTIQAFSEWQLRGVDDARYTLSHLREYAAASMADALRDSDVYVRLHSAQCLGRMGPRARAAAGALVGVLADPQVGATAADALGRIGNPSAVPALVELLGAGHPLELRVAAVRALGLLAPPELESVLDASLAPGTQVDLATAAAEALLTSGRAAPGSRAELAALGIAVAGLTSGRVEPSTCEAALGAWLERRARDEAPAADLWNRWQALAGSSESERQAARAGLLEPGTSPVR